MTRLISFAVLIAIIIIIGLLFYKVLVGFFIPVFLACVLVVVFRPLHQWVLQKTGHRDRLAAVATTFLIMFVLLLPITVVGTAAATQGLRLLKLNDASTNKLLLKQLRVSLGLELPPYNEKLIEITDQIGLIVEFADESLIDSANPRLQRYGARTIQLLSELETEVSEPNIAEGDASETGKANATKWAPRFSELRELAANVGEPSESDFAASKTAVELKSQFADLKTELLGGGLLAFARERANPTEQEIDQLTAAVLDYFQPRLLSITGATGSFLVKLIFGCVIMIVATFFFLYDGPSMVKTVMNLSPLDDAYEQELLLEFDRISRAVVLATLLSAIVQGITAGLGYAVVGMEYLSLLIMLTTVFAMVPFVGPAVVWVPVCLYVGIYEERVTAAVLLALWGVLVVGTVDNLVKALVLHGQSQLHPLLALLSVLGGVQALGPIGIVVGPMVVAMLQTLLSILQRELIHFDQQHLVLSTGATSDAASSSKPRKSSLRTRKRRAKAASATIASKTPGQEAPSDDSSYDDILEPSSEQESVSKNQAATTSETLAKRAETTTDARN